MTPRVLIANRGEIAIRVARACAAMGIESVAVFSEDDSDSLHVARADRAIPLSGQGPLAYLDAEAMVAIARRERCDAVHPGYGFLSESARFAEACDRGDVRFIGPTPEQLALFGDKTRAKAHAARCGVPLIPGTPSPTGLADARAFLAGLAGRAIMIKAAHGGGGRGMRRIRSVDELEEMWGRCRQEARLSFGDDELYVEELASGAKHIEIQVAGDGAGTVAHLYDRECSAQRLNQKVVEVAPSPSLEASLRDRMIRASLEMARAVDYRGLGTFEFLVYGEGFAFIEANPRIQVEHTVTEMVTGVDLVQTQIRTAFGERLDLPVAEPEGYAIQCRINMETPYWHERSNTARFKPTGGRIERFDPPVGLGVRVDTFGYAGYRTSARYDALLAKLICHSRSPDYADAVRKAARALGEFTIEGFETNIPFLRRLLSHPAFAANDITTEFIDSRLDELV